MVRIYLAIVLCAALIAPTASMAQGNNMNIYNKILRDNNQTRQKQKQWQSEDAEATMLDVDEMVRREEEQRRRQQQSVQPRTRTPACRSGDYTPSGCGNFGIDSCCCINGRLTVCRSY